MISGMYFGWNLGLVEGGTYGLAIATLFSILLYVTFTFSYAELACAIPKAGGVFDYASRALGREFGFIAGIAQIIEFVFAPPQQSPISVDFHIFFPQLSVLTLPFSPFYFLFPALNIYGVRAAAIFELAITVLAVLELLLFTGITLPHFKWENLQLHAFPHGWKGHSGALFPLPSGFFLAWRALPM